MWPCSGPEITSVLTGTCKPEVVFGCTDVLLLLFAHFSVAIVSALTLTGQINFVQLECWLAARCFHLAWTRLTLSPWAPCEPSDWLTATVNLARTHLIGLKRSSPSPLLRGHAHSSLTGRPQESQDDPRTVLTRLPPNPLTSRRAPCCRCWCRWLGKTYRRGPRFRSMLSSRRLAAVVSASRSTSVR